jgi:uncharacterized protein
VVSGSPLGLPFELTWLSEPQAWSTGEGRLTIAAGPKTDWFVDPAGDARPVVNAPALVGSAAGDFIFSAHVSVEAAATFDAGVLMLHASESCWAKLCLERSPAGRPMVVSVVTQGHSDDCNSAVLEHESAWLRVARLGAAYAFHVSTDGQRWQLVRYFRLPAPSASIGFEAQSPLGEGCTATFAEIRFEHHRLEDLRGGL